MEPTKLRASGLRIGNRIWRLFEDSEKEVIVTSKEIKEFEDYEQNPDDDLYSRGGPPDYYAGIPLTEDWLLKSGFHRQTSEHYYIFYDDKVLLTIYNGSLVIEGSFMSVKLQYVHQLQNLFFALTGSELTIKEQ